jgi:alpha-tubulin suppressor-like RCC1 family protein
LGEAFVPAFRRVTDIAVQRLNGLSRLTSATAIVRAVALAAVVVAVTPSRPASADMLTLTSPLSSAEYGQPVTFTALIRPDFMGVFEPTGTVAFLANSFPVQFPNNNIPATQLAAGIPISLSPLYGCMHTNNIPVCWGANNKGQLGNGMTSFGPQAGTVSLPPFPPMISLATGADFTCAVVGPPSSTVKCWGNNNLGQLGNTFTDDRTTPTDVVDLNMQPLMVAAGDAHACALSTTGTVKCWGDNTHGQLGTGNFLTPRTSPVDVVGLSGVVSIVARENRTCVVIGNGALKCWGSGTTGLLGDGGNADRETPTDVTGLSSGVAAVSMGATHNCALTTGGGVKCWGFNTRGELGDDSINDNFTPVDVVGLGSGVASVAAGLNHTCALLTNGGVKCWGANDLGQLGLGALGPDQHLPINYAINLASGAITLAAGGNQNCATMQVVASQPFTGGVKCWGDNGGFQTGVALGAILVTPLFQGSLDPLNQPGSQAATYLKATFTTSSLPVGTYTIDASFTGTTNLFSAAAPQISFTITPGTTTTTLSGGLTPILAGEEATFVATVTANGNTSNGAVYFYDGATQLGFAIPLAGVATFTTTKLPAGVRAVTASYSGDMGHSASTSAPVLQTVIVNDSVTTLSSTPNPSRPQQSVTFTANVGAIPPATGVAQDGSVTFKEGSTVLGTVPVANGTAQLSLSSLLLGSHAITAQFSSPSFTPSSFVLNQLVEARVGAEMRISRFNLSGKRQQPAVARAGGRYIVVWQSDAQDGAGSGIFGQRYRSSDGTKIGSEFQVNATSAKSQTLPAVAGLKDEGFIVAWVSLGQDGKGSGIVAQRFGSNGAKVGGEFIVNTMAKGNQSRPAVAGLADGGFVVAWDAGGDGSGLGVFARRFSKTGKPQGDEFQVNTFTTDNQTAPAVTAIGKGFVIAWQSDTQDKGAGIFAQRFKSNASTDGFEFRVNTRAKGNQTAPALASLSDGGFVAAWVSDGQDGDGLGIYGQRFLSTGNRLGEEFRINTTTALDQSQPAVSGYDGGGFVVVWTSPDGDGLGVFGQAFNSDSTPANGEFRANTTIVKTQWQPSVATLATGGFVAVWTWVSPEGSTQGIYGQRLSVDTH